jgi:hypothetical protein
VGDTVNTLTVWRSDLSARSAQLYNSLTLPDSRADGADFIRGLAFDNRGRLAATNFGGAVVLQDVGTWTTVLVQHTGLRLDGVAVDPDGARLYVAGMEDPQAGRAIAYNIADGSRASLPELPQYWTANTLGPYRSVAITRDGRWLMAGGPLLIQWDLTKEAAPELFGESARVTPGSSFSPSADSVTIPLSSEFSTTVVRGARRSPDDFRAERFGGRCA